MGHEDLFCIVLLCVLANSSWYLLLLLGPYHFCPFCAHLCMKCSLGIASFLEEISQFSSVQSHSHVWLFATPWTAAAQASLSITNSWSLLKLMSIELVMPSNHLILCHPLLPPSIFPRIRVFSNESVLRIRWPKYWSFSFSISLSNEYSGLISFRMDWLDLLAVQQTLKSLLQHHSSKASVLQRSAFFMVQLSHSYLTPGKIIALTRQTFIGIAHIYWTPSRAYAYCKAGPCYSLQDTRQIHSHKWAIVKLTGKVIERCADKLPTTYHWVWNQGRAHALPVLRTPRHEKQWTTVKQNKKPYRLHEYVLPALAREASDNRGKRSSVHLVQALCLSVSGEDSQPWPQFYLHLPPPAEQSGM